MRTVVIIIMLLMISSAAFAERYTLSRSDVNRIVFPAEITDVIVSEEKGLIRKAVGTDLYIKFPVVTQIDQETGAKQTTYSELPAEIYVVTNNAVTHKLLLVPAKTDSKVIEIAPDVTEIPELKGKDIEELVGSLFSLAIEGTLPKAFKVSDKNESYKIRRGNHDLTIVYRKVSEGGGYRIREFHIYSPISMSMLPEELAGFRQVESPVACVLTSEQFSGWVRGFVMERTK